MFDIVITGPEHEYLCECKYHQNPRPLRTTSIEVKESVLQFISAEKYRTGHIKRDGIFYLLITNCPTGELNKGLAQLRTASDENVRHYAERLLVQAGNKWKTFDPKTEIKVEWIRNALVRTLVIEIDDGQLDEAARSPEYEQEFGRIIEQVSKTQPLLLPVEYRVRNTIRFVTANNEEETIGVLKNGYFIEISRDIIDQILLLTQLLNQRFIKVDPAVIPFAKSCEILHHHSISPEDSMEIVIEVLNDIIHQRLKDFLVLISPGTYDLYYADLKWSESLVASSTNSKGFYEIEKVAKNLPEKPSRFILASLVRETMRLRFNFIVRDDVMDFLGMEETDYPPE